MNENNDLSEVTLDVKESLRDVCDNWVQQMGEVNIDNIENQFQPLLDVGIATSYIPCLRTALEQASELVQSVGSTIKATVDEQQAIDSNSVDQVGVITFGGNGLHYTGPAGSGSHTSGGSQAGGSYGSGSNGNASGGKPAVGGNTGGSSNTPSDQFNTDANNTGADLTIQQQLGNALDQLDSVSYAAVLSVLLEGVTSTVSLNGVLSHTEDAEAIKQKILQQPDVPDNIKQLITDMDSQVLLTTLKEWVETPTVSDVTNKVVYTYLESLVNSNHITLEDLLKDKDGVVMIVGDFREVSNSLSLIVNHQVEDSMLDIYNGKCEQFDDKSTYFLKSIFDFIATEKNITVEELLTKEEYKEFLNSSLSTVEKDFKVLDNLGYQNFSNVSKIMSNLFIPTTAGNES